MQASTIDPVTGDASDQPRDPSIGLAHELIHGDHYQRGVYNADSKKEEYRGLDKVIHKARIEEQRTVGLGEQVTADDVTENQIREEQGAGLRASY